MKTTKQNWILSLAIAGALCLQANAIVAEVIVAPEQIVSRDAVEIAEPSAIDTNAIAEVATQKGVRHEAIVRFGKDVELKAGDSAEAIIVIGGSAKILGECDEVVVIGGDLDVHGKIRRSAVAVLGTLRAASGSVIEGEVVGVGGGVEVSEGANVSRKAVDINFGELELDWVKEWFVECVLKMRPIAPQLGWMWRIAGVFCLFYFLIALAFPRPVQACVDTLNRRPATTFLAGLLTKLIFPVLTILLVMTGIGVLAIPFLFVALLLGFIVGKVAILQYIGGKIGRSATEQKPLIAFLIGTIVVTLLYMIPFVGLLIFGLISVWGLGAVVTATFASLRRETPVKSAPTFRPPDAGGTSTPQPAPPTAGFADPAQASATTTTAPPPIAQTGLPAALTHPRASFWERMGAAFLDIVLVSILSALVGGLPLGFLVAIAYFAGMWAWKGTTIGGIVLKLQVVRCDGAPVTFLVAFVRSLAAAFSTVVLFLGFFWIAWDRDKQGWHDKIVGTVVVRLPHSIPLVCL